MGSMYVLGFVGVSPLFGGIAGSAPGADAGACTASNLQGCESATVTPQAHTCVCVCGRGGGGQHACRLPPAPRRHAPGGDSRVITPGCKLHTHMRRLRLPVPGVGAYVLLSCLLVQPSYHTATFVLPRCIGHRHNVMLTNYNAVTTAGLQSNPRTQYIKDMIRSKGLRVLDHMWIKTEAGSTYQILQKNCVYIGMYTTRLPAVLIRQACTALDRQPRCTSAGLTTHILLQQ